jgi:hypothetical protein
VSYRGGCFLHDFSLTALRTFTGVDPAEVSAALTHRAFGDSCDDMVTENLLFDLSPLKKQFQNTFHLESGVVEVHLRGIDPPLTYRF